MGVITVNLRCIRKTVNVLCEQHVVIFSIKISGINQEHESLMFYVSNYYNHLSFVHMTCVSDEYSVFSNLIRTLFTVSEGYKIRCGLESRAD